MDWKEFLKPTKGKIILLVVIYVIIFFLILMGYLGGTVCLMGIICKDKPHHNVPGGFPGASCGQICATDAELAAGYRIYYFQKSISILLYIAIPYLGLSALFYVINKLRKKSKIND